MRRLMAEASGVALDSVCLPCPLAESQAPQASGPDAPCAAGLPQPSSRVVFIYLPPYLHVRLQPQRSGIVFFGYLPVFIQLGPERLFNKHPLTQSPPFPSSFKLKVNLSNHVYKFKTHHSH